jgi:hypothetical protein
MTGHARLLQIAGRIVTALLVLASVVFDGPQTAAQAASGNPAGCTMYVDNPHQSSHVPERVNAIVRFSCSHPVTMGIAGGLWRLRWYGWQEMATTSQTFRDKTSGSISLNVGCPNGDYTWYANGASKYEEAWENVTWRSYGTSKQVRFSCSSVADEQPAPAAPSPVPPAPEAPAPLQPVSPISTAPESPPSSPPAPQTWSETTGGVTHTWTNYTNAGGYEGPSIPSNDTVQIACKLTGFRVADGNTWWYRIASSPWNSGYYASADAFYNNGETSGSLLGTPFVDPGVGNC